MLEIAEDRDLAYQTVKNLIGEIKKLLESRTVPYFRETLSGVDDYGIQEKRNG